jgi:hypothetical protein
MFRNAFISEFSFSPDENLDAVLKSHLLSNEKIVIPAATVNKTELSKILSSNLSYLGDGSILIAHGKDRANLKGYIEKYPNVEWNGETIELFSHFDKNKLCSTYNTKKTISKFNKLMRNCATGKTIQAKDIFSKKTFCNEVKNYKGEFDLNNYFLMIEKHISDTQEKESLKAHAMYHYNFFGSFATNSGNTFSLENTLGFNHIDFENKKQNKNNKLAGINILISSALDFTDGIENFNFLSNLDGNFINKLTYKDILEIRQNWLHNKVIEKYECIVQECASSYMKANNGEIENALIHIEKALEIRQSILKKVNLTVQSEIKAYKFFRMSRGIANISMSAIGLSGVTSIPKAIHSAITEIAVTKNKEKALNNLIDSKFIKIKQAIHQTSTIVGIKSPVAEYLHLIEKKLNNA